MDLSPTQVMQGRGGGGNEVDQGEGWHIRHIVPGTSFIHGGDAEAMGRSEKTTPLWCL